LKERKFFFYVSINADEVSKFDINNKPEEKVIQFNDSSLQQKKVIKINPQNYNPNHSFVISFILKNNLIHC